MKTIRKCISILLIALFAVCMTGCLFAAKPAKKVVKAVRSYGCEQAADFDAVYKAAATKGDGIPCLVFYASKDSEEATRLYSKYYEGSNTLSATGMEDLLMAVVYEKVNGLNHEAGIHSFGFGSEDDAKTYFHNWVLFYTRNKKEFTEQGEKKDYSYLIKYSNSTKRCAVYGVYLEKKCVTLLEATFYYGDHEQNDFAEHFCDKMGYVSPMTIYEHKEA